MTRVCIQLRVRPDRIEEYKERHAAVWPGLLIGYLVTPSLRAAQAGMAATEVNARWQAEMAEYFVDLAGASPDTGFIQLEEIFNLEDQLAVLAPDDPGSDLT